MTSIDPQSNVPPFIEPLAIVTVAERPDLVPVVASWLWEAFSRKRGGLLDTCVARVEESVAGGSIPSTFVLLSHGEPIGTASLTAQDLEERPDLTPWLASVFVAPHARRQGHAVRLVEAVEQEARATLVNTLWLYTNTAERIYAGIGWQTTETVEHNGKDYALMRRDLEERK